MTLRKDPQSLKPKHRFFWDESSRGGAEARFQERVKGVKLNHGLLFGRRVEKVKNQEVKAEGKTLLHQNPEKEKK